jgi:hypothetical protein
MTTREGGKKVSELIEEGKKREKKSLFRIQFQPWGFSGKGK